MPLDLTLDLAESTSAADWVKKTRLQDQERAKAAVNQPPPPSSSSQGNASGRKGYSSNDLKGMQIMHDSTSFEVGEEVVLTLADTEVIQRDEYGRVISVNDGDDALENVNIAEGERKEDRDKRLKRLRQPVYRGYDDDEFDEDGFSMVKKPSILPQYDHEKKRGAKLIIGDGTVASSGISAAASKLLAEKKAVFQSLHTDYKVGNDFVDASEVKFKKVKKDDKKRKRVREKSPERDNGNNDDYDMSKILGDDDEPAPTDAVQDSSSTAVKKEASETTSAANTMEAKPSLASLLNKKRKVNFFSAQFAAAASQSVIYDDEDADLSLAMARARQSAISARRKDPAAMDDGDDDEEKPKVDEEEDRGAKFARELALKAAQLTSQATTASLDAGAAESKDDTAVGIFEEEINVEGRRSDGKLVFNSTTEFASRLQARLTDRARMASEAAVKDMERNLASASSAVAAATTAAATEEASVTSSRVAGEQKGKRQSDKSSVVSSDSKRKGEMDWEKLREDGEEEDDEDDGEAPNNHNDDEEFLMDIEGEEDDDDSDEDGDDEVADDEQMAFLHKQPLFAKGLAATLALLKESGELNKPKQQAGRARDVRDQDDRDPGGIRLEYRDEYGNKLTKKEEFRRLSYHFHGQGPGKKKLEKRLKAQKALMRAGLPKAGVLDGTAGTMKSLHRTLEATGRSHVMLQGGVTTDQDTITALAQEMLKKKEQKEKRKEKESHKSSSSNKK